MPIYEFYCSACHTLLSFFAASSRTRKKPVCPHCGRKGLPKRPSTFAVGRSGAGDEGGEADDPLAGLDESRLESAMESVLSDAEGAEDDPRQMANLFRQFSSAAGMEPGPKMEEMLARLEAGADPDELEAEAGDDDDLDAFFRVKRAATERRSRRPAVDKELYFL